MISDYLGNRERSLGCGAQVTRVLAVRIAGAGVELAEARALELHRFAAFVANDLLTLGFRFGGKQALDDGGQQGGRGALAGDIAQNEGKAVAAFLVVEEVTADGAARERRGRRPAPVRRPRRL